MSKTSQQTGASGPTYSLQAPDSASESCEAIREYLEDRRGELTSRDASKRRSQLRQFAAYCREQGVQRVGQLSPHVLQAYKKARKKQVKRVTLRGELETLVDFLELFDRLRVTDGLAEVIDPTQINLSREERVCNDEVNERAAEEILGNLETYDPYSRDHCVFLILWETGCRTSGLRALDLSDWNPRKQTLTFKNRPETGTRLKNGSKSVREVNVTDRLANVIEGYLQHHRFDKREEHDIEGEEDPAVREPLITTRQGRISAPTVRKTVYRLTERCTHVSGKLGPHACRSGAVGRHLSNGWKIQHVSERCDMTEQVLRRNYDVRSESEKASARAREYDL